MAGLPLGIGISCELVQLMIRGAGRACEALDVRRSPGLRLHALRMAPSWDLE